MMSNIIIFEGYDGSGKTTLINELTHVLRTRGRSVRVVGRKTEPSLVGLSQLIERHEHRLSTEAEVLLRIALEFERLQLVIAASTDYVLLDRWIISLKAWVSYYDLRYSDYQELLTSLESKINSALIFLCCCSFETCWTRIQSKETKSAKELMGEEINHHWYTKYMSTAQLFRRDNYDIVNIDTAANMVSSVQLMLDHVST